MQQRVLVLFTQVGCQQPAPGRFGDAASGDTSRASARKAPHSRHSRCLKALSNSTLAEEIEFPETSVREDVRLNMVEPKEPQNTSLSYRIHASACHGSHLSGQHRAVLSIAHGFCDVAEALFEPCNVQTCRSRPGGLSSLVRGLCRRAAGVDAATAAGCTESKTKEVFEVCLFL